jgi:hypothetical protein
MLQSTFIKFSFSLIVLLRVPAQKCPRHSAELALPCLPRALSPSSVLPVISLAFYCHLMAFCCQKVVLHGQKAAKSGLKRPKPGSPSTPNTRKNRGKSSNRPPATIHTRHLSSGTQQFAPIFSTSASKSRLPL